MTWTSGYVAEVDYTHGYYRELAPSHLGLALLLRQLAPLDGPVRYLELGFGQGLSLNIHAAGTRGEYWGTDFNPSHAANALSLAEASGANLRILDQSFAELAARADLPDFDVIALHGIWSWISDENRRVIVDIARRKLKIGGIFYVSYNATPGWSASMPLRHLLLMHADLASGEAQGLLPRIDAALTFGKKLVDAEAIYFKANGVAAERLKSMQNQNRRYLAHEYFNTDWHPMPFADVARYLDDAKLQFAASAHLVDNIDGVNLTPEQQKILAEIGHPVLRETVRDYCVNQQFRRDVWVRGRRPLVGAQATEALNSSQLVLLAPLSSFNFKVHGARGEGQLQEELYRPIVEYLASDGYAPKPVADIARRCRIGNVAQLFEIVTVLCGAGQAALAKRPEDIAATRTPTRRLNAHILKLTAAGSTDYHTLASPVTGGGVPVNTTQQNFLTAMAAGFTEPRQLAEETWKLMAAVNQRLIKDGKRLDTPEQNLVELNLLADAFVEHQVPVLRALEIV